MAFIKHGDGIIVNVIHSDKKKEIDNSDLTDQEKENSLNKKDSEKSSKELSTPRN